MKLIFLLLVASTVYANNNDFLVKLEFSLNNEEASRQILQNIENYNATPKDVVSLAKLDTIKLDESLIKLKELNVQPSEIFSLNSLEYTLKLLYKSSVINSYIDDLCLGLKKSKTEMVPFYEKLNLSLMIILTSAYTDDFTEIRNNAILTEDSLTEAVAAINVGLEDFFAVNRDIFYSKLYSNEYTLSDVKNNILQNRVSFQQLLALGNIGIDDINRVPVLKTYLDDLLKDLVNLKALGAVTSPNNVVINRKVYDGFKDKSALINVFGKAVKTEDKNHLTIDKQRSVSLVELKSEENISSSAITPLKKEVDLENCTYVTVNLNEFIEVHDVNVSFVDDKFILTKPNDELVFVLGSSLTYDEKLVGLAVEENGTHVVFDHLYGEHDIYIPESNDQIMYSASIYVLFVVSILSLLNCC